MRPKPSPQTLQVQSTYDPVCQYCRLIEEDAGPLTEWFIHFAETPHSIAWLHRDQLWPGRCVVAVKEHVSELFHLDPEVCRTHLSEMVALSEAIQRAFAPDKMNYECLGNMVEHVHWHLIPRYESDFLWRRTIWEEPHDPHLLDDLEYGETIERILEHLAWQPARTIGVRD